MHKHSQMSAKVSSSGSYGKDANQKHNSYTHKVDLNVFT